MPKLKGNAIVAQSGGPTAVINSSAGGAIERALKAKEIAHVYGSLNGILGVLREELYDIGKEKASTIEGLTRTPSAALGSCRYKVRKKEDFERIVEVFRAHDIRYFFYAGGNDSMDTADKVARLAADEGHEMRAIGIPKTIDNDLACTDHCPGYGSVAKYNATTVMEAGRDTEALYTHDTSTVIEIMGRNAGWIAAACGVARRSEEDAPDLIYVPEIPVTPEKVAEDVKTVYREKGRVFIAAGEGMKTPGGEYIAEMGGKFSRDDFGHRQLGGVADALRQLIESEVGIKCRTNKHGTSQRNAMHFASLTDVKEAYACGKRAVELALKGETGQMVTLVRESSRPYKCSLGTAPLRDVANGEKKLPREFLDEAGTHITDEMREYVAPLMKGEAPIKVGRDGLPVYVRLEKRLVEKKCPAWSEA